MTWRKWIIVTVLLLLLVATGIGLLLTRDSAHPTKSASAQAPPVDQTPLKTANRVATLALTLEEKRIAEEAARVADHEVDLAFADALREATEHPASQDPKNRDLYLRMRKVQAAIADEQSHLAQLKTKIAAAPFNEKDSLQQQIDLLEAQLALDGDELDDAKQDLIRAGGDRAGTIERLREEHEAGHDEPFTAQSATQTTPVDLDAGNLAGQVRAWLWLKDKRSALESARGDAQRVGKSLLVEHATLESHVKNEESQKEQTRQQAAGLRKDAAGGAGSREAAAATVTSLKHFSDDQKLLSDFDRRIGDEQELSDTYSSWIDMVATQQRAVLHGILRSALWILLITLLVYVVSRLLDRYFSGVAPEKKRLFTLRAVARFALQAVGLLLIFFVVLGAPTQTPTVIGLAGAGLTVALKDFIVGFFGWFVLMGRNGIRVGDWVEINGVVGEVVEIGLLRTVLMETGNWTDTGHPTGRKVAFVNSFAIEGHFFNFSTTGQWLWDELQVLIPPGQNPYPLVTSIQKLVEEETRAGASLAEEEWKKSTSRDRMKSLSVVPAIHLRPTAAGVEMQVRYITSAHERYSIRSRMYEKIVRLLHSEVQAPVSAGPA